ncbi:MAG: hypothetical protein K6U04_10300 [Armatimonadetes bacterium]|nr:hypothetical protein [Armatimonadota bacterium]
MKKQIVAYAIPFLLIFSIFFNAFFLVNTIDNVEQEQILRGQQIARDALVLSRVLHIVASSINNGLQISSPEQKISFIEGAKSANPSKIIPWLFGQLEFNQKTDFVSIKNELTDQILKLLDAIQEQTLDDNQLKEASLLLNEQGQEFWDFANNVDYVVLSKPEKVDEVCKKVEVLTDRLKKILETKHSNFDDTTH